MTPEEFDELTGREQQKIAQKMFASWVLRFVGTKAVLMLLTYQLVKYTRNHIK